MIMTGFRLVVSTLSQGVTQNLTDHRVHLIEDSKISQITPLHEYE